MMKNLSIADIALPHLRVLVDQIHLPAHLAIPDGEQGVFIQKVDAPGLIKIDTYVGRRMDLHCTGVGKVMLAYGAEEAGERTLPKQGYIKNTRNTITSSRALRLELAGVWRFYSARDEEI